MFDKSAYLFYKRIFFSIDISLYHKKAIYKLKNKNRKQHMMIMIKIYHLNKYILYFFML